MVLTAGRARRIGLGTCAVGLALAAAAMMAPDGSDTEAVAAMSGAPESPPPRPDLPTEGLKANLNLMMMQPDDVELQDWIIGSVADSLLQRRYSAGEDRRTVEVEPGDTLAGLLIEQGAETEDANAAVDALAESFDPRTLRAGQPVTLVFDDVDDGRHLTSVALEPSVTASLTARRATDGSFVAELIEADVETRAKAVAGTIRSSLYGDASELGVPDRIIANAIKALSHKVDFQRDLEEGDAYAMVYDVRTLADGRLVGTGDLLMARIVVDGKTVEMFRFEDSDGVVDYYDRSGVSARRVLMRTPIDGARVSSTFGMRRHPIRGYNRMHKGVDFAAPTGTPIYAAGDGTVELLGTRSGYGKYIRIRHNGTLSTAYAHMSRYADLDQGDRVRQGQVIGYVGQTGDATGPHLHYEVLVDGEQVNPLSVDLPTGHEIAGRDRAAFEAEIARIDALLEGSGSSVAIAFAFPPPGRKPLDPTSEAAEVPPGLEPE
jgi:murein DD-endopeptidase MepM/ murein hydrolase activator NlpD